jgi:hypothetical protein
MNYDQKRHIELLKLKENFRSQNKSFLKEGQQEWSELIKYVANVERHIFWKERFEVASLIQAFLNKEMDGGRIS